MSSLQQCNSKSHKDLVEFGDSFFEDFDRPVLEPAPYYYFVSDLGDVLSQVRDLAKGQVKDEEFRPSSYAQQLCYDILIGAFLRLRHPQPEKVFGDQLVFPQGLVSTDEDGHLNIEWRRDDSAVILRIAGSPEDSTYLFHSRGDVFGAEELTGESLALRLSSLL